MAVIEQNDRVLPYKSLHSKAFDVDLNNIVYLLRKFKKLKTNYSLEMGVISGDFGNFSVSNKLVYINNKYRIKSGSQVNFHNSGNIFENSKYTFIFTIVSENASGVFDSREYRVEAETGVSGVINFNISSSILGENEFIMPSFVVEVVFNVNEFSR